MSKLVRIETGNSPILIESTDVMYEGGIVQAGGDVERNLDKMLERLQPFCESVIRNFESLTKKPQSASAEFGLSISAEGNLFFVKASGQATIKVTLNWKFDDR